MPQRQFQVVTIDFDAAVVVNGNDLSPARPRATSSPESNA
jgi:hypothetical protein